MVNEKRLIDANALMAQLEERQAFLVKEYGHQDHYTSGFVEATDKVEQAPTVDTVEVVRCKDCRFKTEPGQPNILCYQMNDDDFCSYGERKDNG